MRSSSSLKREFLKKWILGLQVCNSSKNMSVFERKKAIKLSADVAMASARKGKTCWSRALIANASSNENGEELVKKILGSDYEKLKRNSTVSRRRTRCRKILKRSYNRIRKAMKRSTPSRAKRFDSSSVAKKMIKKRTQVLKSLVPGGESMDEALLIEETLDYIMSVRAQIDVMRSFANATETKNPREDQQW
ncbi:transcription factor IBH1-like 1 [Mangifera indica]|uniref:transcription factor IBH1-like 1 n=1 Tax=Mangifera indica TaxID=29780 RepID=UPI001CFAEE7A|nr:transcription factor IBH1-like 1 [Mangifera indica]